MNLTIVSEQIDFLLLEAKNTYAICQNFLNSLILANYNQNYP